MSAPQSQPLFPAPALFPAAVPSQRTLSLFLGWGAVIVGTLGWGVALFWIDPTARAIMAYDRAHGHETDPAAAGFGVLVPLVITGFALVLVPLAQLLWTLRVTPARVFMIIAAAAILLCALWHADMLKYGGDAFSVYLGLCLADALFLAAAVLVWTPPVTRWFRAEAAAERAAKCGYALPGALHQSGPQAH